MSIAVTQPRRIAAIAAAQQVCREYHGSKNYHLLGKEIGYKIRFENVTTPNVTKLTYMTDGVLLREIIDDPLLTNYNIIIIDEAHERSIETDILLGLMKKACKQRSDLKLLVMSATLNMVKFSDFFDECPIFSIPGRLYDIDIFYQKNLNFSTSKSKYVSLAVDTALNIHQNQSLGHILVFLTGQSEIERACKEIKELEKELDYSTFPYNIKLFNQIGSRDSEIMEKLRDRVFDHENENVKNNYYHNHSNNLSSSLSYSQEDDSMYIKGLYIFPIYSVLETRHQKSIFKEVPPGYRKVIFATNIAQVNYYYYYCYYYFTLLLFYIIIIIFVIIILHYNRILLLLILILFRFIFYFLFLFFFYFYIYFYFYFYIFIYIIPFNIRLL